MSSPRYSGPTESLGTAQMSEEFPRWSEEWLRDGAPSPLLENLGESALVLDRLQFGLIPDQGARGTFVGQEEFRYGREESKHQVDFGQLLLNGPGVHEHPEHVAVKPFEDIDDLKREWTISQYLNGTFEDQFAILPLGLQKMPDGSWRMLSAFETGIKTFDNTLWANSDLEPEALRPENVRRAVGLGMRGLGMMHGSRVIHGDAEAKNLAADREKIRFVDLEGAEILAPDILDDPLSIKRTREDLDAFISSVVMVEQNLELIVPALSEKGVRGKLVKQYDEGVKEGRRFQGGTYIPNLERLNDDFIRDAISDVLNQRR